MDIFEHFSLKYELKTLSFYIIFIVYFYIFRQVFGVVLKYRNTYQLPILCDISLTSIYWAVTHLQPVAPFTNMV